MTPEELRLVRSLMALARIETQIRIIRVVSDVVESYGVDDLLTSSLRDSAATIESSLREIELTRPARATDEPPNLLGMGS